ncbi:hypothetical protein XENOCAPTIV_004459 [Xenoophorus captivus]|uniref:Uncharacterized protein n=1 Tax=Xenoophorus captivus TaxID=1517983 RepID=A0ABV0QYM5_9TELE
MTERADQNDSDTQLHGAISHQGVLLGQHESVLGTFSQQQSLLQQSFDSMATQLHGLLARLPAPPPNPVPSVLPSLQDCSVGRELTLPPPEPFSGNLDKSKGFLLQCSLIFH